jgi:hypothetical protein
VFGQRPGCAPFKVYASDVSPFRVEVAKRIATRQAAAGQLEDLVSAADRARVRTEVAEEFFRKQHGRDPIDAREIAATIARQSRPRTQTVAGYDLTFSPVKSVSTLWAVADPDVGARAAHAHAPVAWRMSANARPTRESSPAGNQCHRCGQRCAQQTGGDDPIRGLDGRRVHVESNEQACRRSR